MIGFSGRDGCIGLATEGLAMSLFREYLLILAGGAFGSVCGIGFGAVVGVVSPEFINALTQPHPIQAPERAGAAMGMIDRLVKATLDNGGSARRGRPDLGHRRPGGK